MEVKADPNLLVVSLDHCISTGQGRQDSKNCIYTASIANSSSGQDATVLQLPAPIQCITEPNQPISRFQHQHLTQLQAIHYSAVQMNYDGGSQSTYHEGENEEQSYYQGYPHIHFQHSNQNNLHNLQHHPSFTIPQMQSQDGPSKQAVDAPVSEEATFPQDDYEYYKEIENFLVTQECPPGSSQNYKKHLRRRALNYLVIDGVLHHGGRKPPKKVIMRKEEQKEMLEKFHVVEKTGVHLGVKKMFSLLEEEHFWKGMYVEVANYVKQCNKCCDLVDVVRQLEAKEVKTEDRKEDEDIDDPQALRRDISIQTSPQVWQEVEVKLNGPYKMTNNRSEYILSITDTFSKFTCACPVPNSALSSRLAEFMVKMFCILGFPRARVACDQLLFESFIKEFNWRIEGLESPTVVRVDMVCCPWLHNLFNSLVQAHPLTWDREVDKFLFRFNISSDKDFLQLPFSASPFSVFYSRSPLAQSGSEDKENVCWSGNNSSKKAPKMKLKCPACNEELPLRKSLKMHQKEDCKSTLSKKDAFPSKKKRKGSDRLARSLESKAEEKEFKLPESLVENTVSAVKAYLAETKEERKKRGRYQKYTMELQEHMASFAVKFGNLKAAKYFSKLLGTHVSDSTIRNIVKSHAVYQPELKEEIARFAITYGVERASIYFSERLNRNVPHNLVAKFKSMFEILDVGGSACDSPSRDEKGHIRKDDSDMNCFSPKLREQIAIFACEHSVDETVRHFCQNVGIPLTEEYVKMYHKEYIDQQNSNQIETVTELHPMVHPVSSVSYPPMIQQHVGIPSLYQNNVCFQTEQTPVIIPQTSTFPYPNPEPFETVQDIYPSVSNEPEQCHAINQSPPPYVFPQGTLPHHNSQCSRFETCTKGKVQKRNREQDMRNETVYPQEAEQTKEALLGWSLGKSKDIEKSRKETKGKEMKVEKESCSRKRGSYTTYSPELRAEIGKYAAEHGSLKASSYFTQLLGSDVPESTARGLKDKYLFKVKHCDVTSLGYCQRGRPLRLGKYDEVVQECLKELVRSGEKVSSFLAITTAREILNKHDPGLLQENGGSIVLNNTWAKSFLKRIGMRNNS